MARSSGLKWNQDFEHDHWTKYKYHIPYKGSFTIAIIIFLLLLPKLQRLRENEE